MKIELNKKEEKLLQTEEIDFDCSEMNTTVLFPDFEVVVSERTLVNSDRHLKKHKQNIELKVRKKELLREQIRLEIDFLGNKLKLFSIQTDDKLREKLSGMETWMQEIQMKLVEDETKEKALLNRELEKSYLGKSEVDLNILDENPSLIDSSLIMESVHKKKI